MLEAFDGGGVEKVVLEALFAVFLTCIDLHSLGRLTPRSVAVGSKSANLVDAAIVIRFVELHIDNAFPIHASLIIVAGGLWFFGVPMDTWDEDSGFVIEQVKRIGADGKRCKALMIASEVLDQIGVGDDVAETLVVFIEHSSTNDNGMLYCVRMIHQVIGRYGNGMDVGIGKQVLIQPQRSCKTRR